MFLLGLAYGSYTKTETYALNNFLPSEQSKVIDFSKYNDFPVTLEDEVVQKMAPLQYGPAMGPKTFTPVLDDLHDAANVNYTGVV